MSLTPERSTPRILILSTGLGTSRADRGLPNELIDGFLALGAFVRVVAVDWQRPSGKPSEVITLDNGVEALFTSPVRITGAGPLIANAAKWYLSSLPARRAAKRFLRDDKFDLVMISSPMVTCGHLFRWALKRFRCRSFAYLTDFFPFHQHAAGQVRGGVLLRIMARLENDLIQLVDVVGCMTRAGEAYLRSKYRLRPGQCVASVTLWGDPTLPPDGDRDQIRAELGLPEDVAVAVFGGQISEGRGIEDILAMAERARTARSDLHFLFIGGGRLEPLVRTFIAEGRGNVHLHPPIARDAYLRALTACTVGLVATIADTGVPTFPSKTMDYLRAGLPIVASIEDSTDYSDFVIKWGFGTPVPASQPDAFLSAICDILDEPPKASRMRDAGRRALREEFNPIAAAGRILKLTGLACRAEDGGGMDPPPVPK